MLKYWVCSQTMHIFASKVLFLAQKLVFFNKNVKKRDFREHRILKSA